MAPVNRNTVLRPAGPLPKQIQITDHQLHAPSPAPERRVLETRPFVEGVARDMVLVLTDDKAAVPLAQVVSYVGQFWVLRLGGDDMLPLLQHPAHAGTLLLPAVAAVLAARGDLAQALPSVVEQLDFERMAQEQDRILEVRRILAILRGCATSLEAVETHLEQGLAADMKRVHDLGAPMIAAHHTLKQVLMPLTTLMTQSGQQAQETRKDRDQVAEETRDRTLVEIVDVLEQKAKDQAAPDPSPAKAAAEVVKDLQAKPRRGKAADAASAPRRGTPRGKGKARGQG